MSRSQKVSHHSQSFAGGKHHQTRPGQGPTRDMQQCVRQQALLMIVFRLVWKGRSPTCRGGRICETGIGKGDACASGNLFIPSSLLKGCRGGCRSADAAMPGKAASTPFTPPACSSICLSAVRLSFLPSDNLTLISPTPLSWSRSFLSQFR